MKVNHLFQNISLKIGSMNTYLTEKEAPVGLLVTGSIMASLRHTNRGGLISYFIPTTLTNSCSYIWLKNAKYKILSLMLKFKDKTNLIIRNIIIAVQ